MAGDRLFIVKTGEGKELEPADQDALIKWAEQRIINLDCKVRSTLVPKWDAAIELPFLKPILMKQLAEKVQVQNDTFWTHLKAKINLKVTKLEANNGLVKADTATYPTADLWIRIAAGITDLLILAVWGVVIYLACAWLFAKGLIGPNSVFYVGFIFFWTTSLLYYILFISIKTQTPGQKCWGIFLIKNNGEDFWMGRTFFYVAFLIPFGIFTPFFVYATDSGRGLHEIISKTRMVKIIYDANKRKR